MILSENEVAGLKEYIGKLPTVYGADLYNFFINKENAEKQAEQAEQARQDELARQAEVARSIKKPKQVKNVELNIVEDETPR